MSNNAPIYTDSYRERLNSAHDRTLRRQLYLSLIVVAILLAATIGTILSLPSPQASSAHAISNVTSQPAG